MWQWQMYGMMHPFICHLHGVLDVLNSNLPFLSSYHQWHYPNSTNLQCANLHHSFALLHMLLKIHKWQSLLDANWTIQICAKTFSSRVHNEIRAFAHQYTWKVFPILSVGSDTVQPHLKSTGWLYYVGTHCHRLPPRQTIWKSKLNTTTKLEMIRIQQLQMSTCLFDDITDFVDHKRSLKSKRNKS